MARSRSPSPEVTTSALASQTSKNDRQKKKNCCNRRCCLISGLSFVIIFSLVNAAFLLLDYLLVTSKKSTAVTLSQKIPWDGNYTGTYQTKAESGHFCATSASKTVGGQQSLAFRFASSEELIRIEKKLNEGPYNATYKPEMFEFSSKPPNKPTFIRKVLFISGTPFPVTLYDQFSRFESRNGSMTPKQMLANITIRGPLWKEVYTEEEEGEEKVILSGANKLGYKLIVTRNFFSQDLLTVSYQDDREHSYCKEFIKNVN